MSSISGSIEGIRAGRAYVEIGATDSKLVAVLYKAAARIRQYGETVRRTGLQAVGAGGAILTPLAAASTGYAEHGAAIERASQKTGIGVEALSGIQYAAKQSGVDIDSLNMSIFRMDRTLQQAARGSKEAEDAIRSVGLTVDELNKLSQQDRFKLFATAISGIKDPAVQVGAAMKIFGRNAADILPVLQLSASGISDYQKRAKELGLTWSGQDAAAALAFSQSLNTLWDVTKRLGDYIGGAVAPLFKRLADLTTNLAVATGRWAQSHGHLLSTIALVSGGVVALGAGLVIAGTVIANVGIVLGTVAAGFGVLAAAVSMVLTPMGLLGAGLLAGIEHFYGLSNAASDVGGFIKGVFKQIYDAIAFVFQNTSNLGDAWKAAQTELGFVVLGTWLTVKGKLMDAWIDFQGFMGNLWNDIAKDAIYGAGLAADGFLNVWFKALALWRQTIRTIGDEVGGELAAVQQQQEVGNRLSGATLKTKGLNQQSAEVFAREEYAANNPGGGSPAEEVIKKRSAELLKQFGGQFAGDEGPLQDFVQTILNKVAANARAMVPKVNTQDKDQDAADTKRLADLKQAVADAQSRIGYYLTANPQTQFDKDRNDDQIAKAKADGEEAKRQYEEALRAQYAKGGQSSLASKFEHLFDPIVALVRRTANDQAGNLEESTFNAKAKSVGAFNVTGQGLASEVFGGGSGRPEAKQTADNTKKMVDLLQSATPADFAKALAPLINSIVPLFS